ncbi:LamG domain-containing protein [Hymenobacter gummosus]|uniref:LamG domain-containing protein n=1 Tax=Hymenobacter gummosus TaxID=1776032 RepID=UPI00140498E1|nr:LamG domain-containing protein [Hymenobacter gummosus]
MTLGGQYTQSVWLRPNINAASGTVFYGVMGNGSGNNAAPYLGVWADGRIEAGFSTGSTVRGAATPTGTLVPNQWNHVVVTFNGSQLLIYHNGTALGTLTTTNVPVSTPVAYFGNLGASATPSCFPGSLDEISLWSRALSQAETRQLRHLTLDGTESGLLAYLQLNAGPNVVVDAVRGKIGTPVGTTVVGSTAPVGYGRSTRMAVTGAGNYSFAGTDLAIDFAAAGSPPYDVVVSRLDGQPLGTQPADASLKGTFAGAYWIIDRYSTSSFAATTTFSLSPADLSPADAATPANLRLFKRDSNGDGTFEAPIAASSADAAAGTVAFPVTSFSQAVIGTFGSSPLPVELLSFTAAPVAGGVRLAWATAQEQHSAYFQVERSPDGQLFAAIGRVPAAGTSSSARAYALTDAQLPGRAGLLYYRLRQVDLDGTSSYSEVRAVAASGAGAAAQLTLLPNPTPGGQATLTGAAPGAAVLVLDLRGRRLLAATADAAGTARLQLPVHAPAGVYVVRCGGQAMRLVRQ